jgi:hypothetical protein
MSAHQDINFMIQGSSQFLKSWSRLTRVHQMTYDIQLRFGQKTLVYQNTQKAQMKTNHGQSMMTSGIMLAVKADPSNPGYGWVYFGANPSVVVGSWITHWTAIGWAANPANISAPITSQNAAYVNLNEGMSIDRWNVTYYNNRWGGHNMDLQVGVSADDALTPDQLAVTISAPEYNARLGQPVPVQVYATDNEGMINNLQVLAEPATVTPTQQSQPVPQAKAIRRDYLITPTLESPLTIAAKVTTVDGRSKVTQIVVAVGGSTDNTITNGAKTPVVWNGTEFGSVPVNTTATEYYTVDNNGTSTLHILDAQIVGADAAAFKLTGNTDTLIAAGQQAQFPVTFTPTEARQYSADVILDTDSTPRRFSFLIQGTGK